MQFNLTMHTLIEQTFLGRVNIPLHVSRARLNGIQEVRGSIPLISTRKQSL